MKGWVSRDGRFRCEFTYGPKSHLKLSTKDARQLIEGGAPTEYNLGQPSYPRDENDDVLTYPSDSPKKLDDMISVLDSLDDALLFDWWTHESTISGIKKNIRRLGGFTSGALGTWETLIKAFLPLWDLNRIDTAERLRGHMNM